MWRSVVYLKTFSVARVYSVGWSVTDVSWIGKDLERSGGKANRGIIPVFAWLDWGKHRKLFVGIGIFLDDIRTRHLRLRVYSSLYQLAWSRRVVCWNDNISEKKLPPSSEYKMNMEARSPSKYRRVPDYTV
jgi:hypothetical protein